MADIRLKPKNKNHQTTLMLKKMEGIVKEMTDLNSGVPLKTYKKLRTTINNAFAGYDLIEWLMSRFKIGDSEALHLANFICKQGFFYPVSHAEQMFINDDYTLYQFQIPYYWPTVSHGNEIQYAIYLTKRSLRKKEKHNLTDFERETLKKLQIARADQWMLIVDQAEAQLTILRAKKKFEKTLLDTQEKSFWRTFMQPREEDGKPIVRSDEKKPNIKMIEKQRDFMRQYVDKPRNKTSKGCETLLQFCDRYVAYDPILTAPAPSNPWISDDVTFWTLNEANTERAKLTELRVRRWGLGINELLADQVGVDEFKEFLKTQYNAENLEFLLGVKKLRNLPRAQIKKNGEQLFSEFLSSDARCEINIDAKTRTLVRHSLDESPSRDTFDPAVDHILNLMKKDAYPRFLRSQRYKELIENAYIPHVSVKKGIFAFVSDSDASDAGDEDSAHNG